MKIFNRVLAMVLALIMTFAVLPLGIFASEDPWLDVDSQTQPSAGGTGTTSTIVVKVDAKRLAEILQTSGLSGSLLGELKSGITVDLASLSQMMSVEELLKIVPASSIMGLPSVDLGAILTELGDKVEVYFNLNELFGELTEDELNALVNAPNALPVILDYYKSTNEGLAGLLETLLTSDTVDENPKDGIPDNCPIRVVALAHAPFWTDPSVDLSGIFTDEIFDIDVESYIKDDASLEDSHENGFITLEEFLNYWPIDPVTGTYDISFLNFAQDVKENEFLAAAEDAGKDTTPYVRLADMINDYPALRDMIQANPNAHISAAGMMIVKSWIAAKDDWDENDFNLDALKAALGVDDVGLYDLMQNNVAVVENKVAEAPATYLVETTLKEIITGDRIRSIASEINLAQLRADALSIGIDDERFYDYVRLADFIADNTSFLVHNINTFLTADALSKVHHNIDIYHLATNAIGIENIIHEEGLEKVVACTNLERMIELVGDDLDDYVYISGAIKAIGVEKIVNILLSSGVELDTVIDVEGAFEAIGYGVVFGQLSVAELLEIVKLDSVKVAIPDIVKLVLTKLPYNIDEITIGGKVVATENTASAAGELTFDIKAILKELAKLIPTLDELATLEGDKLFSADFGFTYTADPLVDMNAEPVTKSFKLEVVLEGGADLVRKAAVKLSELVNKYVDYSFGADNVLTLDIKVPAKVTSLYAKVLASGDLPESIRQKILELPSMDGNDAVALLENLTLAEIVEVLDKVESTALYDKFMQIGFVEKIIDKIAAKTGKDLSAITLEDVLAKLDDAIDKAGSVSLVNKIYGVILEKTGIDVTSVLEVTDIDAAYQAVIDNADDFEGKFTKIKNYVLFAIDKVAAFAPAALETSIGDLYRGNGVFDAAGKKTVTVGAQELAERVLRKLATVQDKIAITDDMIDLVLGYIPEDVTLTAGLDVTVRFANLYRVVYHDTTGAVLFEAFLPANTALSIYKGYTAPEGVEVDGWRLLNGTPVTKITGDIDVYPNIVTPTEELYDVIILDESGNTVAHFYKKLGEMLTAYDLSQIPTQTKSAEAGYQYVYKYVHNWYLQADANKTPINLAELTVAGDITVCSNFTKEYFFEIVEDGAHDITVENGKYVVDLHNDFAHSMKFDLPRDYILKHATEDTNVVLTLKGENADGKEVSITVDNATLRQMFGLTGEGDIVRLTYDKVQDFEVSFYNDTNSHQYDFDLLLGADEATLKSYKDIIVGDNKNFDGSITVKVPFASHGFVDNEKGTHVYYTENGTGDAADTRELISSTVTADHQYIVFNAKHFSTFVIANEHYVTYGFESNDPNDTRVLSGTIGLTDAYQFFPVGATITIVPDVTNYTATNVVYTKAGETTLFDATAAGENKWTIVLGDYDIDITVKMDYSLYYTVTFYNEDGSKRKEFQVLDGTKIKAEQLTELGTPTKTPAGFDVYLYEYILYWHIQGEATRVDIANHVVSGDISFQAGFDTNYFFDASNNYTGSTGTGATVSIDAGGNYVIALSNTAGTALPTYFTVTLPTQVGMLANAVAGSKIIVVAPGGAYNLMEIDNATAKQLFSATRDIVKINAVCCRDDLASGYYHKDNASIFSFDFIYVSKANGASVNFDADFAGKVKVTVPFANGIATNSNSYAQTRVHYINGTERTLIDCTVDTANGRVAFDAKHFSMYAVANEYRVTFDYEMEDANAIVGALDGRVDGIEDPSYFPLNTTITLKPIVTGHRVVRALLGTGIVAGNVQFTKVANETTWTLVMTADPAAEVEITFQLKSREYRISYYINDKTTANTLYQYITYTYENKADVADIHNAIVANIAALGLTAPYAHDAAYTLVGFDANKLGKADMEIYVVWTPTKFTANFMDGEDKVGSVEFDINTNKADLSAPNFIHKDGLIGSCADWDNFDIAAAIADMIANNVTTTDLAITYAPRTYQIIFDGNVVTVDGSAKFGDMVVFEVADKVYYTKVVKVLADDGTELPVAEGMFRMPASNVSIVVTYTPVPLTYYINGKPVETNKTVGDVVTFTVLVAPGYQITSMSKACTLVNSWVDENGVMVFEYAFQLLDNEYIVDNAMRIDYTIEAVNYDVLHIFNGTKYEGEGDPVSEEKKVSFGGWSDRVANSIVFATYDVDTSTSLVWLWILLVLIVLIALIIVLYRLYINGKLKPNFVLRFVTWIVSGFFAVCFFVATVGLYIISVFGKKEEDFDYYFADDDEEIVEETVEEEVEEEAVEEVVEEAAEEVEEEAVEEVVEEAAEEVAEEAVEAEEASDADDTTENA